MATLERIRRSSGLLIIVIGMAMLAFILTDLFSSGNSFLRGGVNAVGVINGEKIDIREFNKLMEQTRETYIANTGDAAMNNATEKQFADQVWNRIIREKLYSDILAVNGLEVPSAELYQRIIQNPNIRNNQSFRDPNTGQFSEAVFKQALSSVRDNRGSDPQVDEMWGAWVEFENAMKEQGRYDKFHKVAQSAIYYPEALARQLLNLQSQNFRSRFVTLRYTEIADSTIDVSEADMRRHIQENASLYERENERDILYVNFRIEPSEEDRAMLMAELEELKENRIIENEAAGITDTIKGFGSVKNDSLFVVTHSEQSFDNTYYRRERLLPELDSAIWEAPIGYVHGPYAEGDVYQLAKVTGRIVLPDSVKARHILIAFQGAERAAENVTRTPQEAMAIGDSLLKYIEEDRSRFDAASDSLSDDVVARSKGGDLGWFTQNTMAKPFGDFCFYKPQGTLGMVYTNFGVHIVEISNHSAGETAIRVARIARTLQPSETTIENIYNQASSFAAGSNRETFTSRAEEAGYAPRPVTGLKEFDENITGLGNNRAIVRWTFEEKRTEGDIQLFSNGTESYAVVLLDQIKEEGLPSVEEVEALVKPKVILEKKKEQLAKRMKEAFDGASSIEDAAAKLGIAADKIFDQRLNFMQVNVTGVGGEPDFVAMMSGMPLNEMFAPFAGERAVFAGMVVERDMPMTQGDVTSLLEQNQGPMRTRLPSALIQAMEDQATIKDMRAKFY